MAYYDKPIQGYTNQQPGATMTMDYTKGGNRNAKNLPVNSSGKRNWSHGICGCCGACGTCCVAWFCPCITYGRNKKRIQSLEYEGRVETDPGCCSCDCCLYGSLLAFAGLGCIFQMGTRGAARRRYHIKGNGCTDCLAACFCTPCDLTQVSREIDLEERSLMR